MPKGWRTTQLRRIVRQATTAGLPLGPLLQPHPWVRSGTGPDALMHAGDETTKRCRVNRHKFSSRHIETYPTVEAVDHPKACTCVDVLYLDPALRAYVTKLEALIVVDDALRRLEADPQPPRWVLWSQAVHHLRNVADVDTLGETTTGYATRMHRFELVVDQWRNLNTTTGLRAWAARDLKIRGSFNTESGGEDVWRRLLDNDVTLTEYHPGYLGDPSRETLAAGSEEWNVRLDYWAGARGRQIPAQLVVTDVCPTPVHAALLRAAVAQFGLAADGDRAVLSVLPVVVDDVLRDRARPWLCALKDPVLNQAQAEVFLGLWNQPGGFADVNQAAQAARLCA